MKYLVEDSEVRYGGLIGFLNEMQSNEFQFRHIWDATKHLYHYIGYESQPHPYCDVYKMQKDIKRAVSEGYLTTYGKKSASKYVKTEKLLSEKFINLQVKK